MASKKVKVKVKKKKLKIKKILITLLIFAIFGCAIYYFLKLPVKNIYISGNEILSDKQIIILAKLEKYPPFIDTYFNKMKENLLKNDYISEVTITRKFNRKIYINIKENVPLCIYHGELVLSSKVKTLNVYNIDYVPYITNDIDPIYDKFVSKFSKIDKDILLKISHIEYVPNEVDKERLLLFMTDANYVYITLSKTDKINKYNSIVQELGGKKGIIYLDSGSYVEIKG